VISNAIADFSRLSVRRLTLSAGAGLLLSIDSPCGKAQPEAIATK
jgi:hypothetical protein